MCGPTRDEFDCAVLLFFLFITLDAGPRRPLRLMVSDTQVYEPYIRVVRFPLLLARALPTETQVESGTSQSKSGTSVNLSNSGFTVAAGEGVCLVRQLQRSRGQQRSWGLQRVQ